MQKLTMPAKQPDDCQGFSLIEVLVATAVLVVIVLMVSMVFQQSTIAWDTGLRNAQGNMTVRTVLGSMQREIAGAVDGTAYGVMGNPMDISGGSVRFISLGGEHSGAARSPRQIEYSFNGGELQRTETPLTANGGNWSLGTAKSATLADLAACQFGAVGTTDKLPRWLEVTVTVNKQGEVAGVHAYSFGPNGEEDGPESYADEENPDYDDIYSW